MLYDAEFRNMSKVDIVRSICPMRLVNPPTINWLSNIWLPGNEITHFVRERSMFIFYDGAIAPVLSAKTNWPYNSARNRHTVRTALETLRDAGFIIPREVWGAMTQILPNWSYGPSAATVNMEGPQRRQAKLPVFRGGGLKRKIKRMLF